MLFLSLHDVLLPLLHSLVGVTNVSPSRIAVSIPTSIQLFGITTSLPSQSSSFWTYLTRASSCAMGYPSANCKKALPENIQNPMLSSCVINDMFGSGLYRLCLSMNGDAVTQYGDQGLFVSVGLHMHFSIFSFFSALFIFCSVNLFVLLRIGFVYVILLALN